MSWYRIVSVVAVLCSVSPLGGCKKKTPPKPKELASLKPHEACKHFFGRVKSCAPAINRIKADKLGLKGGQREAYLRQVGQQVKRAFSNLELLCERYAIKSRKQQTDMDRCYRMRTCERFGQCFVKMADADITGPGGKGVDPLKEIRKQLQQLKKMRLRRPGQGLRPGEMAPGSGQGQGHRGHMHAPTPKTRPRP